MGGNETTFLAEDSSSCRNVGVNVKARRSFNGRGGRDNGPGVDVLLRINKATKLKFLT